MNFNSWFGSRRLLMTCLVLVCGLAAPGVFAAKGAGALEQVKKAGKLLVAIDATYPPMESEGPDGKPVGFDIDFANELAKRLGVKAEFVVMNWDGILAGLNSKRYDVIISSMNITEDRKKQVDFVEYVRMSQLFITKAGVTIGKEADLAGKVVAVQADTTSHEFAEKVRKSGVAVKDIKAFKLATDAFAAVKAGQAEVIIVDEPVGRYYAKQDAKTFQSSGRAMAPEPVGIAIRKTDADLQQEINKAVEQMKQDGTLKKISETWFGGELGA
jgi:polar amino acid transport system substrate-binding protein